MTSKSSSSRLGGRVHQSATADGHGGPVTAETITDEQIRELLETDLNDALKHGSSDLDAYRIALRLRAPGRYWTIAEARARCAAAWNARQGKENGR